MIVFLCVIIIINAALLAAGAVLFVRLKSRLAAVDLQAKKLAHELVPATDSLMDELKKQTPIVMSVEILNPLELAANESSLAGTLGSLSPNLIRKIVYDRAADIIRTELAEKGVDAELRVIKANKDKAPKDRSSRDKTAKNDVKVGKAKRVRGKPGKDLMSNSE